MYPDTLPEFSELIPSVEGDIFEYNDATWFKPEDMTDILYKLIPDGATLDLIRVGLKVYEIIEWDNPMRAYRVTWFRCNLTDSELMKLSGQHA